MVFFGVNLASFPFPSTVYGLSGLILQQSAISSSSSQDFFFPLPLWVDRVPLQQTMVVIYDLMKGRVPVFEKALQEFDTLLLFPFASPFH